VSNHPNIGSKTGYEKKSKKIREDKNGDIHREKKLHISLEILN